MGVVAVDSTGTFEEPPVLVVAVRKVEVQRHNALRLTRAMCTSYEENIGKNWRERVSAACIFKSIYPLIKKADIIQIERDFLGRREDYLARNLKRLFGIKFAGKHPLSNPTIQFIPAKFCPPVKEAHQKTQYARHKSIKVLDCPSLDNLINLLE